MSFLAFKEHHGVEVYTEPSEVRKWKHESEESRIRTKTKGKSRESWVVSLGA